MGGEQAAKVMSIITREKWIKQGKEIGEQEEGMLKMLEMQIINKFDEDSHPFAASARLFDDGIIDPRDSRRALALTLSVCRESQRRELRPNSFGVARF